MGRDAHTNPDGESAYECFNCRTRVVATSFPGACPECGGTMRNCGTPLE